MFYRIKFDNLVGCILTDAGYRTNGQKFAVWAAGTSRGIISEGKKRGLDAKQAAFIGLSDYFYFADHVTILEKVSILGSALMHATIDSDTSHHVVSFIQNLLDEIQQ